MGGVLGIKLSKWAELFLECKNDEDGGGVRGERGAEALRCRMYSSALAAGLEGVDVAEESVCASKPSPTISPGSRPSLRAEGGGVSGVDDEVRLVCLGPSPRPCTPPALLCIRLLRPPELAPAASTLVLLNGSHSDVCAGVERMPLLPTDSESLLKRLIDDGDGEEAKKRR